MRIIHAAIAALFLTALSATNALAGNEPMLQHGLEGPEGNLTLADRIDAAVQKKADGSLSIEGSTCTTPAMYLQIIRDEHPEVGLADQAHGGFALLTAYIRTLKRVRVTPEMAGDYYTSRIVRTPSGCSVETKWAGGHLRAGEWVYVDRNTDRPTLRGNCGNGNGDKIVPKPKPQVVTRIIEREVVVQENEACSRIELNVPASLLPLHPMMRVGVIVNGVFVRTHCWDRCDGTECHSPTHPCDDCRYAVIVNGIRTAMRDERYDANYAFTDVTPITQTHQVVWVPRAAENAGFIALCVFLPGKGESLAYLAVPPGVSIPAGILSTIPLTSHWHDHAVTIPDDIFPAWDLSTAVVQTVRQY